MPLGHFLIDYFRKILIPRLLDILQKDLYRNCGVNGIQFVSPTLFYYKLSQNFSPKKKKNYLKKKKMLLFFTQKVSKNIF